MVYKINMKREQYQDQLCFPWSVDSHALITKVEAFDLQEECLISCSYLKLRKGIFSCAAYNSQGRAVYLQIKKQFIIIFDKTCDRVIDLFESSPQTCVLIRGGKKLQRDLQNQSKDQMKTYTVEFSHSSNQSLSMVFEIQAQQNNIKSFQQQLRKKFLIQRDFHQRFKPIRKIGKGSTASVFTALRLADSTELAIKAFNKSVYFSSFNGRGKEVFQQEFRFLSECSHPNVCRFEGVYETENSVYVVMQKYDLTLENLVRKPGPVPRAVILSLMQQMLRAVAYLHDNGIMHRDLKLENIMLRKTAQGIEPVLIDLGLAEEFRKQVFLFEKCGTPGYVAPESFLHRAAAPEKCDIFSLGVIFHILLYKKPIFQGSDLKEVLINNQSGNMAIDEEGLNGENSTVRDLLKRMLDLESDRRISARQALEHPFFESTPTPLQQKAQLISPHTCECI